MGLVESGTYGQLLSDGSFLSTAHRTPGTSLIMAPFYFLTDDVGATCFLTGLGMCFLTPFLPLFAFKLARLHSFSAGLLAYLMILAQPTLYTTSTSMLSDLPFAAFFAIGNLLILDFQTQQKASYRGVIFFGAIAGAASLVRPLGLQWGAGIAGLLLLRSDLPVRRRLTDSAIILCTLAIMVAPWLIRNKHVMNSFTMSTISGDALVWSYREQVGIPAESDPDDIARLKEMYRKNPQQMSLDVPRSGLQNRHLPIDEANRSAQLQLLARDFYLKNPAAVYRAWYANLKDIFFSQSQYSEWLALLHGSLYYRPVISAATPIFPDVEVRISIINEQLAQLTLFLIKYLALPGFILLIVAKPGVGMVQAWSITVIAGMTAIVSGYDRFRLPIDPIIYASVAWLIITLWQLARRRVTAISHK